MRTNKKGFTLIELLAVIVILAIIALIATPIVMNLIGKARQKSAEDSAYGIIKAGETFFVEQWAEDENYNGATFTCNDENSGSFKCKTDGGVSLEFNGSQPTDGTVTVDDKGAATISGLKINGYTCNPSGTAGKVACTK